MCDSIKLYLKILHRPILITYVSTYSYGICIRQADGYCCIEYSLCSDANSNSLGMHAAIATQDTECTEDWIGIAGKDNLTHKDRFEMIVTL